MGQQQILILILVIVIVALAAALAMQVFRTSYVNFEEDKYSQILMETGEQFQAVYAKPVELGGGGKYWTNVGFNDIQCSFGGTATRSPNSCRAEDGSFIVLLGYHGNYMGMQAVAHIGGSGNGDMYTRQLRVYQDSLVFQSDWIAH